MRKIGRIFCIVGLVVTLIGYIICGYIIGSMLAQEAQAQGGAEQVTVGLLNAIFVTAFAVGLLVCLPVIVINIVGICLGGPKSKPNTILVMGILLLVLGGNLISGILYIIAYTQDKNKTPQVEAYTSSSYIEEDD